MGINKKKMDIITNKRSVIKISYGFLVNGPNRNEKIAKIQNFWPILACLTILEIVFWQKKSYSREVKMNFCKTIYPHVIFHFIAKVLGFGMSGGFVRFT